MHPIRFYQLHSFLVQFGGCLVVGIYIPYLLNLGLSSADIFLINAVFWLSIALTEVLTGALADGKSRGWSVRIGIVLSVLGTLIYATAMLTHTKWLIMGIALVAEILEGIGSSFMSGAQQAWISDALKHEDRELEQTQVMGKAAKWSTFGALAGGGLSFLLVRYGYMVGWLTRAAFILLALGVCAKWMNGEGEPKVRSSVKKALKDSLSALNTDRGLKWAAAVAVAFGLILPFNLMWVPHFTASFGSAKLALIWVVIICGLAAGARIVEVMGNKPFKMHGLPLALGLAGIGLASLGLTGGFGLSIAFILLHEIGRGMFQPLMDDFICSRVGSSFKATYNSLNSMISRGGFALVLLANWFLLRKLGNGNHDNTVWLISGSCLFLAAVSLWYLKPKESQTPA